VTTIQEIIGKEFSKTLAFAGAVPLSSLLDAIVAIIRIQCLEFVHPL